MQHLTRYLHKTRITRIFKTINAVTNNRIAIAREMATNLIGTPRLNHNLKKTRVIAYRLAQNLRNSLLAIKLGIDRLTNQFISPNNNSMIKLLYAADFKLLNSGFIRGEILSKQ